MKTYICAHCGRVFEGGWRAPARRYFCNKDHYNRWRAENAVFDHEKAHRQYHQYTRAIWGGSGKGRAEIAHWAQEIGRKFEVYTLEYILPMEDFTEVVDLSGSTSNFFIDFVATKDGQRVLVDATIKFNAHVPKKTLLAEALQMPLYIVHVPPAAPHLYHIQQVPNQRTHVRVPMAHIHKMYELLGKEKSPMSPDPKYRRKKGDTEKGREAELLIHRTVSPRQLDSES